MNSRKLYLASEHFSKNNDVWIYTPTTRVKDSFENLSRVTIDTVSLILATEPNSGSVLIESDSIGRKSLLKTPLSGQEHRSIICAVTPDTRHQISTTVTSTVSDQNILDISGLICFLDWDFTDNILPSPSIGSDIATISSRSGSELIFNSSTNSGLTYETFGTNTHCLQSAVNWHYSIDSTSANNPNEGSTCTLTMMFRTKPVLSSWHWIFKSPLFQISAGSHTGGPNVLGFYDDDNNSYESTSLLIEAGTDYLLQIKKSGAEFNWLLRNLTTNAEQTEVTGTSAFTGLENQSFALSNAQTGLNGMQISHVVLFKSVDSNDCLKVKNWMISKYSGEATSSTTQALQWICHPGVSIPVNSKRLDKIDLNFSQPVTAFSMELTLV